MVKRMKGFTLVELMIVIVIIGILVALVLPNYNKYVLRTNRNDMKSRLIDLSQKIESKKLTNGTLAGIKLNDISTDAASYPLNGDARYTIKLKPAELKDHNWILEATPVGRQNGDGMIRINNLLQKCWVKGDSTCTLSDTSKWKD